MSRKILRFLIFPTLCCLVSCGERDEIATVTCNATPDRNLAIQAKFRSVGHREILLNRPQFAPGSIIRIPPGDSLTTVGIDQVVYALGLTADSYLPESMETLAAAVIPARHFTIYAKNATKESAVDIRRVMPEYFNLWFEEPIRRALRDPIAAVNDDEVAVAILRNAEPRSRVVIVSTVWFDDNVDIYAISDSLVGLNTVQSGPFYFHFEYSCPPLTAPEKRAEKNATRALLFSYQGIKYDPVSNLVILDERIY